VEIGIFSDDLEASWQRARLVEGCEVTAIVRQEWGMTDYRILTPHGVRAPVVLSRPVTPRDAHCAEGGRSRRDAGSALGHPGHNGADHGVTVSTPFIIM
jgi:hypothetical protein